MPSLSSIELKRKHPSRKNKHNYTLSSFIHSEKESKRTNTQTHSLSKGVFIEESQMMPVEKNPKQSIIHHFKAIPNDTVLYTQKGKTGREVQDKSVNFNRLYGAANSSATIRDNLIKWSVPRRAVSSPKATSISVGGLAAYNFNSVKARSNLIHKTNERAYLKSVQQISKRVNLDKLRAQHISKRSSKRRYSMRQEYSEAILTDYPSLPTEQYLNVLQSGKFARSLIFGQSLDTYNMMQQYVANQKDSRDIAEFIIQEIKLSKPQGYIPSKTAKVENKNSLQGRREPVKVRRVLCSVDKEECD